MNDKLAIITGITGQDGFYMAENLLSRRYRVIGLSHSDTEQTQSVRSQLRGDIEIRKFNYFEIGRFEEILNEVKPSLVFNFAAKATGQGMFDDPYVMNRLNGGFILDILESIRRSSRLKDVAFCQASSSEMFGEVLESPQTERTCCMPISPYGAAKLYAHNMIRIYRKEYKLNCSSAILYNHESIRRSDSFVTKKIASAAARILLGLDNKLTLGDLTAKRDWGYAPEYVNAMYLIAKSHEPDDYIVSTGVLSTVADLCDAAFGHVNLDYRDFVSSNASDMRKNKSINLLGNPGKILTKLGWKAETAPKEIMEHLVDYEVKKLKVKRV